MAEFWKFAHANPLSTILLALVVVQGISSSLKAFFGIFHPRVVYRDIEPELEPEEEANPEPTHSGPRITVRDVPVPPSPPQRLSWYKRLRL